MSIRESVSRMDPPRYTISQAADMIGRSEDTLKRWRDNGYLEPSDHAKFGSLDVVLYTPEDIKKGREIARTLRPGRKRRDDEE